MIDQTPTKIDPSRIKSICDGDYDLPVGRKVSITSTIQGNIARFWTKFVGFEKNKYILVNMPHGHVEKQLPAKIEITARFITGSLVCGFTSTVHSIISKPASLLVLNFPECIEVFNLRSKERASCFFTATIYWESREIAGRVLDISKGGCKVITLAAKNKFASQVRTGAEVICQIQMENPARTLYAKSSVRQINKEMNKYVFGLEFLELPEDIQLAIEEYVTNISEYIAE